MRDAWVGILMYTLETRLISKLLQSEKHNIFYEVAF